MEQVQEFQYQQHAADLALQAETIWGNRSRVRDLFSMTDIEYSLFLEGKHSVDTLSFAHFASELGFGLESFFNLSVDLDTLKDHANGNTLSLPLNYSEGATSKKFSFIMLMKEIEMQFGAQFLQASLRKLQIHSDIANDPNGFINYKAFDDLFANLMRMGVSKEVIHSWGKFSFDTLKDAEIFAPLRDKKNTSSFYETYLTEILSSVEKNNLYKVKKITPTYLILESHENPEMLEMFKIKRIGKSTRCIYRAGILSGASQIIGKGYSQVIEEKCVHRGDSHCVFKIYFA